MRNMVERILGGGTSIAPLRHAESECVSFETLA